MKKILLTGSVAMLLSLTACDTKESDNTWSLSVPCINLVTNLSDGTTLISDGSYKVSEKTISLKGYVGTNNLIINNNSVSFETPEMSYRSYTGYDALFNGINTTTNNGNYEIKGSFYVTPHYYVPIPGINYGTTAPLNNSPFAQVAVGVYTLGNDYKIRTFQKNTYFYGETTTTYPQSPDPYKTQDILYGLTLNKDEVTGELSATIIMYNAKFSGIPQEPTKTQVVLKDLPVDLSNGAISITATDVVPEDELGVPNPNYTVNSISFNTTSDDLTTCRINYQVATVYNGSFTGKYVLTPSNTGTN